MQKFLASRRGATAVEFALVIPIVLIMVAGIFEMGRAMWIKATMQFVVEETTRYAIVNSAATDAQLITVATGYLNDSGLDITLTWATPFTEVVGTITYIDVTATYAFSAVIPLVPLSNITLTAKSRLPISTI